MANTSLTAFRLMFPKLEHSLLPDTASYESIDADTMSGGLRSFRNSQLAASVPDEYTDAANIPSSFYRFTDGDRNQWLFFDTKTDVVRSAVYDDVGNLTYISGIGDYPLVFSTDTLPDTDVTIDSSNAYKAGISKPLVPTINVINTANPGAGSTRTNSYRVAYIRTWDTAWNAGSGGIASGRTDLGPMSDVALTSDGLTYVTVDSTKCARIVITHDPNLEDEEHRTHIVVYRNDTTTDGTGSWREVTRFPMVTSGLPPNTSWISGTGWVFIDKVATESLGAIAENEDWIVPDGLQGLISLKNGITAGFVGNTVHLSVPYLGHAFPFSQTVTTDFDIIGLGAFQSTLVICTVGNTYLCVCNDPASPILTPIHEAQSCVSADSIVSLRDRVMYAAPYGLIAVTGDGATQVTEDIIGPFRWGDYNPPSIKAACFEGNYLFFFDSNTLEYSGAIYNVALPDTGILGLSIDPYCLWHDDISTDVYGIFTDSVLGKLGVYAIGKSYSEGRGYTWTSKKFLKNTGLTTISAVKVNFLPEYVKITKENFEYVESSNPIDGWTVNTYCLNGDSNDLSYNSLKFTQSICDLTFYGDDQEWDKLSITSNDFYRIKSGRRFDSFFVKVSSTIPIIKIQMATSAGELE